MLSKSMFSLDNFSNFIIDYWDDDNHNHDGEKNDPDWGSIIFCITQFVAQFTHVSRYFEAWTRKPNKKSLKQKLI